MGQAVGAGTLEDTWAPDDRALAVAAILAVAIASTLAPHELFSRNWQAILLGVPAAFAAAIVWTRDDRLLFAPPVALLVAAGISGVVAAVRGTSFVLDAAAVLFVVGLWLPWPRMRTRKPATAVLWALALAPLLVFGASAVLGWSDWPARAIDGRRVMPANGEWNLAAWSLLWSVLASCVLLTNGRRWARLPQAVSLLLVGATGARTTGAIALVALAVMVWRDRHTGAVTIIRRHAIWLAFALAWLPRVLPRLGSGTITTVPLTGRDRIWSIYWDEGREFLATGGGIGLPQHIAGQRPGLNGMSPHNEYLWVALSVGVLGVLLVGAAWAAALLARRRWVLPGHPELLVPAVMLPLAALVDDPLIALTFTQPYLVLLAAAGGLTDGGHRRHAFRRRLQPVSEPTAPIPSRPE